MARNLVQGFVAVVVALGGAYALPAQEHVLQELYGRGVHAYYSREYDAAFEALSQAIDQGSRDPRCFYFRGLALEKAGRPDEAAADFKKGAELELTSDEQIYDISRSLQRVQGPERIKLEESRHVVRVELRKRKLEFEKSRYEAFKRAEERVIRKSPPPLDDTPLDTAPPAATPAKTAPADDPFAAPPAKGGTKPGKPADDPFADPTPAKPAAGKPAADDPFGGAPAAKPSKPAPPKPAADDPFADEPPSKPAAPAKPAPPKPASDDPFADDAPPSKPAPAAKPGEKPAPPKPATDDPFGT